METTLGVHRNRLGAVQVMMHMMKGTKRCCLAMFSVGSGAWHLRSLEMDSRPCPQSAEMLKPCTPLRYLCGSPYNHNCNYNAGSRTCVTTEICGAGVTTFSLWGIVVCARFCRAHCLGSISPILMPHSSHIPFHLRIMSFPSRNVPCDNAL